MINNKVKEKVAVAIKALEDKKAEDIRVIDISNISTISDCFVIAHANSSSQLRALVEEVEEKLEEIGVFDKKVEGEKNSGWVLIDYTDFILHIFDKENRLFYNLEKMWRDGVELSIDELVGGNDEA